MIRHGGSTHKTMLTRPAHKRIEVSVGLSPDFGARAVEVCLEIAVILHPDDDDQKCLTRRTKERTSNWSAKYPRGFLAKSALASGFRCPSCISEVVDTTTEVDMELIRCGLCDASSPK